jgi:adiponectin receptor
MNIWTHLLGCLAFFGVAIYFLTRPSVEIQLQEKLVFTAFFAGAIACLGLSAAFHTLHCHSEFVGKLFSK